MPEPSLDHRALLPAASPSLRPWGPQVGPAACSQSPPWACVPMTSTGWGGGIVLREPGPPGTPWEVWTHTPPKQTSQNLKKHQNVTNLQIHGQSGLPVGIFSPVSFLPTLLA